jgi:hypothetical protein
VLTDKEKRCKMDQLRPVSKLEKIMFPIIVTVVVCMILPTTAPLVGMLMLGKCNGFPERHDTEDRRSRTGRFCIRYRRRVSPRQDSVQDFEGQDQSADRLGRRFRRSYGGACFPEGRCGI